MALDRELVTIEPGKRANLAILDANPLDDIRNIRRVRRTVSGGRMHESGALWKSVRFAPLAHAAGDASVGTIAAAVSLAFSGVTSCVQF